MSGKDFKGLGLKAGDKVKCLSNNGCIYYEKGQTYTLVADSLGYTTIGGCYSGYSGDWEKVKELIEVGDTIRYINALSSDRPWKTGVTVEKIADGDSLGYPGQKCYYAKETGTYCPESVVTLVKKKETTVEPKARPFAVGDLVKIVKPTSSVNGMGFVGYIRVIDNDRTCRITKLNTGEEGWSNWSSLDTIELVTAVEEPQVTTTVEAPPVGVWQIWNGGECPVADGTTVRVQFDDQTRRDAEKASFNEKTMPYYSWDCLGRKIIAYKVVEYPAVKGILSGPAYFYPDNTNGRNAKSLRLEVETLDGEPQWETAKVSLK